ncbi:yeats-domain-containing protein [Conidiobolus coronatus NRRL 28638]|uniref:Protein AF-9 homolog n=1 Tax=Conidiobolus coronatus (strain ATCC 28846 / CBS 209.66 / NRRL 28638) TaxID=796925 RepID=A0A137NU70_CONC2|nr:yeats-domain-containing protein [Conidiobolus coronatus NRRL 28638]|eukprot:KXN66258.1 yeats-domain-containing protein [Conidiobolus coronatus NRRL 28638]
MKTLNKKLKIVTKVELTKKVIDSGHKIRKWKMWLESMEMKDGCLDFIQSVTYFLHPSFENPERVITEPPFILSEKGWGQFPFQIQLSFYKNLYPPVMINHELLFDKPQYSRPIDLEFKDPHPRLLKRLVLLPSEPIAQPAPPPAAVSTPPLPKIKLITKPKQPTPAPPPQPKVQPPLPPQHTQSSSSHSKSKNHKPREITPPPRSTSKPPPSATQSYQGDSGDDSHNEDISPDFTRKRLFKLMNKLEGPEIYKARKIVLKYQDPKSYIKEIEDREFHFDLYTLNNHCLRRLWDYGINCKIQRDQYKNH